MTHERTRGAKRGPASGPGGILPWAALMIAVVSLALAVTTALVTGGRAERLRSGKEALEAKLAALETANADLAAAQESLKGRLKSAEADRARIESRLIGEGDVREMAADAARRAVAARRPAERAGNRGGGPDALAGNREAAEKRADDIAAIREKVGKKEMTAEEGRKAVEEKVKAALPAEWVTRMEERRAEREKNMTPEEKKRAEATRAAVLDGMGDWAAMRKKVQDGEMTQEEARAAMQKRWRERTKAFRKRREEGRKLPDAKEEF